jgi:hypothetical protein
VHLILRKIWYFCVSITFECILLIQAASFLRPAKRFVGNVFRDVNITKIFSGAHFHATATQFDMVSERMAVL